MISKILIVISLLVILLGLLGSRFKSVGKKLAFLVVTNLGVLALAFVQLNNYGLLGGIRQVIFRIPALLCFVIYIKALCGRNGLKNVDELGGAGRKNPYAYAMLVIFSLIMIGIPGTGTFQGLLYSEIGIWSGGYGVFTFAGMLGNLCSMLIIAILVLPMLKDLYFPEKEKSSKEMGEQGEDKIKTTGRIEKPGRSVPVFCGICCVLLVIACIYQNQIVSVVAEWIERQFS